MVGQGSGLAGDGRIAQRRRVAGFCGCGAQLPSMIEAASAHFDAPIGPGIDFMRGRVAALIQGDGEIQDRTFEIEFLDPGVQAFAFTFG